MPSAYEERLDPVEVAASYVEHADSLRQFLRGLLRDPQLANDVLQTTFAKLLETGHATRPQSRRAWLFQVAYREAMALRRRQSVGQRVLQQVAWMRPRSSAAGDDTLVRRETIERVREALRNLSAAQQQIVRMRIYDGKTFAEIAQELGIPLGTALGRMRAALKNLRAGFVSEYVNW
jgi:RNA polymerase sigma-70 factor (ECF subfamily)